MKRKDIVARVGPSQRAENMYRMLKGSTYTTSPPPIMTSSSFDFRAYLKNIFALEPLLKLVTFVVAVVIYQNVKKKVTILFPASVIAAAEKGAKKQGLFSK